MRNPRLALTALMLVVMLAACGGGNSGDTTTPADDVGETTTTPTTVATTADSGNEVSSLADMPQECIDAFRTFLQEIEPIVEGRDFNAMTQAEMEALSSELEAATAPMEEEVADCPELDMEAEDSIAEMREFAEAEAPGTVAYFVWLQEFIESMGGEGGLGGGAAVSGDCETDIAAMQAMVDAGGTMSDLTVGELAAAGQLITAISTECAAERLQEFMEAPDVEAWMSG